MAVTPTLPRNKDRVWRKILSVFQYLTNQADKSVGAAKAARIRRKVWVSAGIPDTDATGISPGDLVLDTTNDEVYRFISTGVFVNMTADS